MPKSFEAEKKEYSSEEKWHDEGTFSGKSLAFITSVHIPCSFR